jgi:hypothetical protein
MHCAPPATPWSIRAATPVPFPPTRRQPLAPPVAAASLKVTAESASNAAMFLVGAVAGAAAVFALVLFSASPAPSVSVSSTDEVSSGAGGAGAGAGASGEPSVLREPSAPLVIVAPAAPSAPAAAVVRGVTKPEAPRSHAVRPAVPAGHHVRGADARTIMSTAL